MKGHKTYIYVIILIDWLSSLVGWSLFFYFRKYLINSQIELNEALFSDQKYWLGILIIPLCWIAIFSLVGTYEPWYKKSRMSLLISTFWAILIGALGILFLVLFDDDPSIRLTYVQSFLILSGIFFLVVSIPRMLVFTLYRHQVLSGSLPLTAISVYKHHSNGTPKPSFQHVIADIPIESLSQNLKEAKDLHEISFYQMDDSMIKGLLDIAYLLRSDCQVRVMSWNPDANMSLLPLRYDFDTDSFKIYVDQMRPWQSNVKRLLDLIISSCSLVLLLPVSFLSAILIKMNSKGPILYSQNRVGRGMRSFAIYKFRTMYNNAESNGPQLSHKSDVRITGVGKYLRKYRIDEIPQFINVVLGQMSIVGPRPERPYFVDQILEQNKSLSRLYSVRPGITSWGQVKYGYASTMNEIMDRTKFDLLYLNNRSLFLDLRIMLATIKVIIAGKGH